MDTSETLSELTPEAIKCFRNMKGLSQQNLATQLGVGVATVSRWERGTLPTGTAAAVLRTVIASSNFGLKSRATICGAGYSIYQLLKEVFELDTD